MTDDGVVALRAVTERDIQLLYTWRNDESTRRMFRDDRALDLAAHERFVRQFLENSQGDYWWIAEAGGVPVGTICLFHFSPDRRVCEFGRFIVAPDHRGRGYGRRILMLAMEFARSIAVERLLCVALTSNERAFGLYQSLGFVVQERNREGERGFILMETELSRK